MKHLRFIAIMAAVTAVLVTLPLFGGDGSTNAPPTAVAAATPAPEWTLTDVDGKKVSSTDFKGKVVVLDFWATWCAPCREEIPGFIALQNEYGKQGLVVVGVSVDEGGAAVVKKFMKEQGMNYPVVLADDKILRAYGGIDGFPTTFVINRQGQIVKGHLGAAEKSEFEAEIKPLLKL